MRNPGRVAGFFYLLLALSAPIRNLYIPGKLFVHDDAAATARNLAAHEALFRLGIVSDLFAGVILILLVLALYRLLARVDRTLAVWLFPLAILIYRSRFLPRFLGVWLAVNGVAYVAISLTGLLAPAYEDAVSRVAFPALMGELATVLWLLVKGASPPPLESPRDQGLM